MLIDEMKNNIIANAIFIFCILTICYAYLGYISVLTILKKLSKRKINALNSKNYEPEVSIIIAAFNEESNIAKRIENLLEQDYPEKRKAIIPKVL